MSYVFQTALRTLLKLHLRLGQAKLLLFRILADCRQIEALCHIAVHPWARFLWFCVLFFAAQTHCWIRAE